MIAQPKDSTTAARLDAKTRTKGYCGYRLYNGMFCAGPLFTIKTEWLALFLLEAQRIMGLEPGATGRFHTPFYGTRRCVFFPHGWVEESPDVWRECTHAHQNRQRGYSSRYRTTPSKQPADKGGPLPTRTPLRYPAWAICPYCERSNVLDPLALEVVTAAEALASTPSACLASDRSGA